jgi:hypothetical protein
MTTTLIINAALALAVFAVIVGMKVWAIATAHRDAGSLGIARRRHRAVREDPHPRRPAPSGARVPFGAGG